MRLKEILKKYQRKLTGVESGDREVYVIEKNQLKEIEEQLSVSHVIKWVACKDELPTEEKKYLCYNGNNVKELRFIKEYLAFECFETGVDVDVSHWMPLPEPPCA